MHAVTFPNYDAAPRTTPCGVVRAHTSGAPGKTRALLAFLFISAGLCGSIVFDPHADAYQPPPQAPACVSWLPHGYGGEMQVFDTGCFLQKSYWGFRSVPEHAGSWGQPLWGWDVNGFYRGPNRPKPDPGMWQLPIGLIYPEHGPAPRQPPMGASAAVPFHK